MAVVPRAEILVTEVAWLKSIKDDFVMNTFRTGSDFASTSIANSGSTLSLWSSSQDQVLYETITFWPRALSQPRHPPSRYQVISNIEQWEYNCVGGFSRFSSIVFEDDEYKDVFVSVKDEEGKEASSICKRRGGHGKNWRTVHGTPWSHHQSPYLR